MKWSACSKVMKGAIEHFPKFAVGARELLSRSRMRGSRVAPIRGPFGVVSLESGQGERRRLPNAVDRKRSVAN